MANPINPIDAILTAAEKIKYEATQGETEVVEAFNTIQNCSLEPAVEEALKKDADATAAISNILAKHTQINACIEVITRQIDLIITAKDSYEIANRTTKTTYLNQANTAKTTIDREYKTAETALASIQTSVREWDTVLGRVTQSVREKDREQRKEAIDKASSYPILTAEVVKLGLDLDHYLARLYDQANGGYKLSRRDTFQEKNFAIYYFAIESRRIALLSDNVDASEVRVFTEHYQKVTLKSKEMEAIVVGGNGASSSIEDSGRSTALQPRTAPAQERSVALWQPASSRTAPAQEKSVVQWQPLRYQPSNTRSINTDLERGGSINSVGAANSQAQPKNGAGKQSASQSTQEKKQREKDIDAVIESMPASLPWLMGEGLYLATAFGSAVAGTTKTILTVQDPQAKDAHQLTPYFVWIIASSLLGLGYPSFARHFGSIGLWGKLQRNPTGDALKHATLVALSLLIWAADGFLTGDTAKTYALTAAGVGLGLGCTFPALRHAGMKSREQISRGIEAGEIEVPVQPAKGEKRTPQYHDCTKARMSLFGRRGGKKARDAEEGISLINKQSNRRPNNSGR